MLSRSGYQPPLDLDSELEGKSVQKELLVASELPVWYEHYTYVQTGYREPQPFLSALRTVFTWHNETLCIHSHLWPGLASIVLLLQVVQQEYFAAAAVPLRALYVYCYAATAFNCLCSAFTHTFQVVNAKWFTFLWRLDQVSILSVTTGHFFFDLYTICIAILHSSQLFWGMAGAVTLVTLAIAHRVMTVPGAGLYWGTVYPVASSSILTLPLTIYVLAFSPSLAAAGIDIGELRFVVLYSFICSLCVAVAGVFFVGKVPEVWLPHVRALDYFHSHIYFHIFTYVGTLIGLIGCSHLIHL